MTKSWRLGFAFFLLGSTQLFAHEWNVFGTDDRLAVTSNKYPWSTIGRMAHGCTGTLVAPDLMITAAHCLVDNATHEMRSGLTYFYPNLIENVARAKAWMSKIWFGTKYPDTDRSNDWAIVQLDEKLGDTLGWMGVTTEDHDQIHAVGYAQNFRNGETAGAHIGCWVRKRYATANLFLHDCDNGRGASGGPVFVMVDDKPYLVGINVAEFRQGGEVSLNVSAYAETHANIAVAAESFLPTLRRLKGETP